MDKLFKPWTTLSPAPPKFQSCFLLPRVETGGQNKSNPTAWHKPHTFFNFDIWGRGCRPILSSRFEYFVHLQYVFQILDDIYWPINPLPPAKKKEHSHKLPQQKPPAMNWIPHKYSLPWTGTGPPKIYIYIYINIRCLPAGVDPSVVDVNGRTCLDVPWRSDAENPTGWDRRQDLFHGDSPTVWWFFELKKGVTPETNPQKNGWIPQKKSRSNEISTLPNSSCLKVHVRFQECQCKYEKANLR